MKTQNQRLIFKKNSVSELNDSELNNVNGGGTPLISLSLVVIAIIEGCSDDDDPCEDGGAGCGGGGGGGGGW